MSLIIFSAIFLITSFFIQITLSIYAVIAFVVFEISYSIYFAYKFPCDEYFDNKKDNTITKYALWSFDFNIYLLLFGNNFML